MKRIWSRMLSILLVAAMIFTTQNGMVSAAGEEPEEKTEAGAVTETVSETVDVDTDQLPDNEELLDQYVQELLYPGPGISLYADFGASALTGRERAVYNALKAKIESIASSGGSTQGIEVSIDKITWTSDKTDDALMEEASQELGENIDVSRILDCLLADCPSTFYWYDKTIGVSYGYSISSAGSTHSISQLTFRMAVAAAYQDSNNQYSVGTTKVQAASEAVTKADAIVSKYAGSSDYAKLSGYLTEICNLVSYNSDAASEEYTGGYGDPWQLIYVFDGDESTNVVCEGYAKAFQYLCDKSSFSQKVTCYTVTGTMAGGTGAGGHMWNIVSIAGNSYLVDVTNCDAGTVGNPDKLFLKGNSTGAWNDKYTFNLSQDITYTYDDDQKSLYGEEILTLASADYTPSQEPEPELIDISDGTCRVEGGDSIYYNGTNQWVKVIVEVNGKILESSQYLTSFENATNAGTASYTVKGYEAAGYTGELKGTFEIQKAPLTITSATVAEKTYDGTTDATVTSVTFEGLQQSDNLQLGTDYTASAVFEDAAGGTDKKVTVTVTLGDTTLAKNYELEDNTLETTGTINKIDSQLGLTVDKKNVTYGESVKFTVTPEEKETTSFLAMLQDLINPPKVTFYAGDVLLGEVSVSDGESTDFTYSTKDKKLPAGTHTVRAVYSGSDGLNGTEESTEITIHKKGLTVSVYSVEGKEYDGTTDALGSLQVEGILEGDFPSCSGTFAWTSASAGTATVNVTGIHFTGANAEEYKNNYTIPENLENQPAGTEIRPKDLTNDMFAELSDMTYKGQEQTPTLTVVESLLTADGYTVVYSDNKDVGEATVTVTGKGNFTGELELRFNINPARFTYSVVGGNVKIGNGLDRISVSETAAGVNGEQVEGTLAWYMDEGYSQEAGADYVFAGSEGDRVTLYWKYTPAEGQTNYSAAPLKGQTEFTLQAKTVPVLHAESYSRDYDGKAVTLEDLTATASAADGDTRVKGTWNTADPASVLKDAGSYEVELIFTPEDTYNYAQVSMKITVEIRKLDATVSLRLSTNRITTEDPLPEAKVVYTGVLKGESLTPETKPAISGMPEAAAAGAYTVRWENSEEILTAAQALAAAKNYKLTAGTTAETLTITGNVTVLPQPDAPAGTEYRLEMENGISQIPDSLKEKFETVEELREALLKVLVEKQPEVTAENSEMHDIKLYISTDNGRTWIEADETNFPEEGITLTIPYPEGTNAGDYKFVVSHIFTSDVNGFSAGEIETVSAQNKESGIQFTLMGLSPVCISWVNVKTTDQEAGIKPGQDSLENDKNPDITENKDASVNTEESKNETPLTGDETNPVPWIMMMIFSTGILAVQMKRKNKNVR